jgi:uncharacterized HAD superfamily protein
MSRETIAVDVDDVLASEREAVRNYINGEFGTDHTLDDYSVEGPYERYWEHVWQVPDEVARQRFEAYLRSGIHESMRAHDGAVGTIERLRENYDLAVVTSRQDILFDITRAWLEECFPRAFKRVEFVAAWSKDEKVSKAVVCRGIGASYLIDDNLDNCRVAAEVGIKGLLFGNYGWNRNKDLPPGVVRVENWKSIGEYFGV